MKQVIIIIPTYNERENILVLVPRIFAVTKKIKNFKIEILIVDDNSPDKTYEAVQNLQKKYQKLHLLINPQKGGLGNAYLKGMDQAFNQLGADYIFEFDADGSHDPNSLPLFFEKLEAGYDFVIGGRYKNGGSIDPNWPLLRKFYSVFGNLLIMLILFDFSIRDWTSGYRAISKKVYQAVIPQLQGARFSGYTWQIGFLHQAVRRDFKIIEVPINFVDRKIGQSKLGSEYIKNTLIYILKARAEEILAWRFFKFACTGLIGLLVQLISFYFMRQTFLTGDNFLQVANGFSIELAIISNFVINYLWTFADRRGLKKKVWWQFLQFNFASLGSALIQLLLMQVLVAFWGVKTLLTWGQLTLNSETLYQLLGIVVALFLNYFIYNNFIWRRH